MAEQPEVRRRSSLFALSRAEIAATSQVDHSDQPADVVGVGWAPISAVLRWKHSTHGFEFFCLPAHWPV
jgi:hypothetical protein